MITTLKKNVAWVIPLIIATFIFISIPILGTTNIANAQVGTMACNSGAIFSAIGSALGIGGGGSDGGGDNVPVADDQTESNTTASKNVQCTWNGVAWQLAQVALHLLTTQVVNWINGNGGNSNPTYLTNPEGYYRNLSDQTAVNFLGSHGPLNNGSPFSNNIVSALALGQAYGNSGAYNYNLNAVISGVPNTPTGSSAQGFINGDFSQGGWSAFIALNQPNNNQSGQYLQAQSDLMQQQSNKQSLLNQQLQQGNGFLSWQNCTGVPDENGDTSQQTCTTETPGSVISAALNKQLGAPTDQLNMTHDINEVVDTLFSNLLSNTLNGGLLSASQPSAGNNGQSLLTQLVNNDQQTQSNSTSLQGQIVTQVQSSAASAVQAVAYRTQTLTNITAELNLYQTTASCITTELAIASSTQNSQTNGLNNNFYSTGNNQLTFSYLQNELTSINSAIASINQIVTKAQSDLQTASSSVARYQNMANQIQSAPSLAAANTLSNQLSAQIASTPYSGASDPKAAQTDLTTINTTIKTLETARAPYQTVCNGQMPR